MAKAYAYLKVKNTLKVMKLYREVFNATFLNHVPYTEEVAKEFGFPDDFDFTKSTMHSLIDIYDAQICMADDPNLKDHSHDPSIEILLDFDNKEILEKIYHKAKDHNFKIRMELEKTIWNAYFAKIEDPFGIVWQLNYQEPEELPEPDKSKYESESES